ncbi:MAG: hypothetical protein JWO94_1268 [Verrucomicrobiaceae bacterium]|nr:hypothetical protein [Verrucomicrobiaceae bacterium]
MKRTAIPLLLSVILASLFWQPSQLLAQVPVPFGQKGFATAGNLTVASVSVGTPSTGYTASPTVTFTRGNASVTPTGTSTLKVVSIGSVAAGGTGYSVGNVLTLVGGGTGAAATFTVSSVSTGAVTAVTITTAGAYTGTIATTALATTGGAGTGCTLTVAYGVGSVVITNPGSGFHTTAPTITFGSGSAVATAVLSAEPTTTVQFAGVLPLVDTVVDTLTPLTTGDYRGDTLIQGKTLKQGTYYPISGNAITLVSGYLLLGRR